MCQCAAAAAGSLWSLAGAVLYAVYVVMIKRRVDREDKLDIPMFFGKAPNCRHRPSGDPPPPLPLSSVAALFVRAQVLWVCSTCCCCGRASCCFTTRALRPSSCPASWFGPTSSSTASSAPFSQSSCGSGGLSDFFFQHLWPWTMKNFFYLICLFCGGGAPQGLLPHVVAHRDPGPQPHHPALHSGRHLHAEGAFVHVASKNRSRRQFLCFRVAVGNEPWELFGNRPSEDHSWPFDPRCDLILFLIYAQNVTAFDMLFHSIVKRKSRLNCFLFFSPRTFFNQTTCNFGILL